MGKFIIEIVHPLRFLKEYRAFEGAQVRIGRGYDNDLILADPHVSAHHVLVQPREQGGWLVADVSRENGMYVRKFSRVADQAYLASGDEIIIGRTRLRFLAPEHPVAAAKLLVKTNAFFHTLEKPVNAWSIFLISTMIFTGHVYLNSTEEISILKLASGSLGFLLAAFLWAGAWAFIGRMIRHKTGFAAQLSLSLLFLIGGVLFINVSEYAGYSFNSVKVEVILAGILLGGLGTAFLTANMTLATNVSFRKRIAVCSSIFGGIIAVITLLYYSFKDEFNPNPMYFATLKPPFARSLSLGGNLSANRSIDQFLAQTTDIFNASGKTRDSTNN